jgi:hypothetical protein
MIVIGAMTDLTRSKSGLLLENALLQQQIIVLQRQGSRDKAMGKGENREQMASEWGKGSRDKAKGH